MKYVLLISIAILFSCDKEEELDNEKKSNLIGSWDCYYGIYPDGSVEGLQYSILLNYEHGFEIFDDGIYKSRYSTGTTLEDGLVTKSNSGTWQLKTDTLSFIYVNSDEKTSSLHFLVLSVDKNELKIELVGAGLSGAELDTEGVMKRTYYLRRPK